jgi:hypothetical protein
MPSGWRFIPLQALLLNEADEADEVSPPRFSKGGFPPPVAYSYDPPAKMFQPAQTLPPA